MNRLELDVYKDDLDNLIQEGGSWSLTGSDAEGNMFAFGGSDERQLAKIIELVEQTGHSTVILNGQEILHGE